MRRFSFIIATVVAVWLGSAVRADAQKVTIDVTGLPPGASVVVALAAANLNKTEPIATSTAGSASGVLDIANLGKAEPIQREAVQVYILDCADPARVVRVVLVADGGQAPRDCDEKQQGVDKKCRCRPVALPIFLTSRTTRITIDVATGTAQAFEGAPPGGGTTDGRNWEVLVGGGAEYANNTSAEIPETPPPNFTRTSSKLQEKGWDGTFFAELYFMPWLGAGYACQGGSKVTFDDTVTFTPNPRLTLTGNGELDPTMNDFYGTVRIPARSPLQVFVQAGATVWKAGSNTVFRALRDGTTVLDETRIDEERDGVAPYFAGGVDLFLNRYLGTRVKYSYVRLKDNGNEDDQERNEKYHTVAILFVVKPWPLR